MILNWFLRILAGCWALLFVGIIAAYIDIQLIGKIPHRELLRPVLAAFLLSSLISVLLWIYREGMKKAGKRG